MTHRCFSKDAIRDSWPAAGNRKATCIIIWFKYSANFAFWATSGLSHRNTQRGTAEVTAWFIKIWLDFTSSSTTANKEVTRKVNWAPRRRRATPGRQAERPLCTSVTFRLSAQCPLVSFHIRPSYILVMDHRELKKVAWNMACGMTWCNTPGLIFILSIPNTPLFRAKIQGEQQWNKLDATSGVKVFATTSCASRIRTC